MLRVKETDTVTFQTNPFTNLDAVSVYNKQTDGRMRMLTVLWNVKGTNDVADFCRTYTVAVEALQECNKMIEENRKRHELLRKEARANDRKA